LDQSKKINLAPLDDNAEYDDLSAALLATAVRWQIATIDGTVLLSSS